MGYFYAPRLIVGRHLLIQEAQAFEELKKNVRAKDTLICAENAAFDKKDILKGRGYRWSDGSGGLPKSWWKVILNEELATEKAWLDEEIFSPGRAERLPQNEITAHNRYSFRAERIN